MHTIVTLRAWLGIGTLVLVTTSTACAPGTQQPTPDREGVRIGMAEEPVEEFDSMAVDARYPPPPGAPTCPEGSGASAGKPVGPERATVALPPQARRPASLEIPADSRRPTRTVRIWEVRDTYPTVEVQADGNLGPVTLRISYAGCTNVDSIQETGPAIYRRQGNRWAPVGNRRVGEDAVEAQLQSNSRYAVGAN